MSVYSSAHEAVSVPTKPSRAAASYASRIVEAWNPCGVCTRTRGPRCGAGAVAREPSTPTGAMSAPGMPGTAPPVSRAACSTAEASPWETSGRAAGVVDGHGVDGSAVDAVGEVAQGHQLGFLPGLTAGDDLQRDVGLPGVDEPCVFEVVRADHEDEQADAFDGRERVQAPGGDAATGQRQERLVDPGPDPGARAPGEHHTGGPAVQAGGAEAAGLGHAGNRRRPGISRGSPS